MPEDEFESLREAAAGIGIQIKTEGELPRNDKVRYLCMIAMRECATNAVRHAMASILSPMPVMENM